MSNYTLIILNVYLKGEKIVKTADVECRHFLYSSVYLTHELDRTLNCLIRDIS